MKKLEALCYSVVCLLCKVGMNPVSALNTLTDRLAVGCQENPYYCWRIQLLHWILTVETFARHQGKVMVYNYSASFKQRHLSSSPESVFGEVNANARRAWRGGAHCLEGTSVNRRGSTCVIIKDESKLSVFV